MKKTPIKQKNNIIRFCFIFPIPERRSHRGGVPGRCPGGHQLPAALQRGPLSQVTRSGAAA